MGPNARRLIRKVGVRVQTASVGSRFHVLFLAWCGIYAAALLAGRLFTLIPPEYFDFRSPLWVLIFAGGVVLALVLAVILAHRCQPVEAARRIDETMQTKDVFLTVVQIDHARGQFRPLVLEDAERAAQRIEARSVLKYGWLRGIRNGLVVPAVLVAGVFLLPQLDLLGRNKAQEQVRKQQEQMAEARKLMALRVAQLKKSDLGTPNSKEVEQTLEELKKSLNGMKPKDVQGNLKRLTEDQRKLADLWRQRSEAELANSLSRNPSSQGFGSKSLEKQAEWKKGLEKGDLSGIRKEIAEITDAARKLDELSNSSEKSELKGQIQQRLRDLSDFVEREMNSRGGKGALTQAMDQLGGTGVPELSKEALEALAESLNLTELELSNLVQSMNDLKSLEEAMKACQLAKRLNDLGALDGEGTAGLKGIGDYAELYKKMMAGMEPGEGAGMQGPGIGEGGQAPEDEQAKSDFVSEQSKSALTAGKVLLQWKTKEISDPGKASIDFRRQMKEVKQGASEAILREQVPPGYHDAIRQYFDNLEGNIAPPDKK